MKKNLLPVLLLISAVSFSQEKHPVFRMIASGGVAIGEKNVSSVFQVAPGLYYRHFFAGIGTGLDDYRFRSIPLFADMRYNFGRREFGFIYANTGYNFPFDIDKENPGFKTTDIYTGGFYGDFGMGMRFLVKKKHAFLFSTGYSVKNISNKVGYTYQSFVPPAQEEIYHFRYSMTRIVSKLSWEIGRR